VTDVTGAGGAPTTAEPPPERRVWLVRHGETEWARLGRHTGRTDIPLTDLGREQAVALGRRFAGDRFALVLSSPLARAAETARLAGFGDVATIDADLSEWDYGDLEGRLTADIRQEFADWSIWTGPWPGGETADEVAQRVDRVLARCLDPHLSGDVLLFSHGHLLRMLAARWLGLPPASGGLFALATATVSVLGWDRDQPVIEIWNEACHLRP
jgi:broad specificity phosphatase PhoE